MRLPVSCPPFVLLIALGSWDRKERKEGGQSRSSSGFLVCVYTSLLILRFPPPRVQIRMQSFSARILANGAPEVGG